MSEPVSLEVHNEAMKRLDAENSRQNHRIDLLEENVREISRLTTSVEKMAVSMENMSKEQVRQGERLEQLEGRDGEMWRKVVGYILTTVVGLVLGLLFNGIAI